MAKYSSSKLTEIITWLSPDKQKSDFDGRRVAYSNAGRARAAIEPKPAAEVVHAEQTQPRQRYDVVTPYRRDVTDRHRLLWGDVTLEIVGRPVDPDNRRRWLVFEAIAG